MINPAAAIRDWLAAPHEHEDMADAARDVLRAVLAVPQPDLTDDLDAGVLTAEEAALLNDGWTTAQHGILRGVCQALGIEDDAPPPAPDDAELVESLRAFEARS